MNELVLITEAEEKGFKTGTRYICARDGGKCKLEDFNRLFYYDYDRDGKCEGLTDGYGGSIYFNGKWAEIVSQPEDVKEEKKPSEPSFISIITDFIFEFNRSILSGWGDINLSVDREVLSEMIKRVRKEDERHVSLGSKELVINTHYGTLNVTEKVRKKDPEYEACITDISEKRCFLDRGGFVKSEVPERRVGITKDQLDVLRMFADVRKGKNLDEVYRINDCEFTIKPKITI